MQDDIVQPYCDVPDCGTEGYSRKVALFSITVQYYSMFRNKMHLVYIYGSLGGPLVSTVNPSKQL
jgi:hypothetical protein